MKSIYSVIGLLLLLLIQGCWQKPSQDAEKESRLLNTSEMEAVDESREHTEAKRHSQGTFMSDYAKLLEAKHALDLVQRLMSTKRTGAVSKRHNEIERHAEGTYTSDISSYLEGQAVNEFIRWLMKGRGRRDFSETDIEEMDRRHADGTVTSDINSVLESIATREFLNWLINAKSS